MTARLPRSQLPCFQHVIVLGKGDLSSCCSYHSVGVWMWSVPHPRCLCRGHGHGVCPGRISLLSEPSSLPQPLSSFWLPHPTSPSFSLSSWPPWDEKLCPTTCSLPCYFASAWTQQQWSLSGEQKKRKKEKKNPYVVFSSFLSPREKAD